MRLMLISLLGLALAACASAPPVYGPAAAHPSGIGFSQVRIEDDRWRVNYTASGPDARLEAERLVLRRAAELTVQNGFDWFEVVDRLTETEGSERSPVRVGGTVSRGWGSRGWSGTGVGIGVSVSPGQGRSAVATIEIIAGRGAPIPERAYDAAAMLRPGGL